MAHPSAPDFVVLHALRLKGMAEAGAVAALTGLDLDDVGKRLEAFAADGLTRFREGRVSGWMLTADGRAAHADALGADRAAMGDGLATVRAAYEAFLAGNDVCKQLCTDWQLRGADQVNDHTDTGYDDGVIARLASLDADHQPVFASLAGAADRFAGYGPRFSTALRRVQAAETDWFTKPLIDSYHTVWFELHENLLLTLGIERSEHT